MKNEKARIAIYSSVITFLVCAVIFAWFVYPNTQKPVYEASDYDSHFSEIKAYIDKYSIFEFNSDEAYQYASTGYLSGLTDDRFISSYSPEEYAQFISDGQGNFSGIGIQFFSTAGVLENGLQIWRVVGDSPAETAGVRAGDVLYAVNGDEIYNKTYNDVLDLLDGDEGKTDTLCVYRGEESLDFTLTRTAFVIRDVTYSIIDTNIGLVEINEFTENVYEQFKAAIESLSSQGVKGIIYDLRNNPGGNLDTVSKVVDLLVPAGSEIAIIESKDSTDTIYAKQEPLISLPSVVLVNRSSASAAELFASSMRDLLSAPLVGEATYGKGVGQQTFTLSDGSAIKLTTFKYYTKSRTDYNNIGLKPDYEIEMTLEEYKNFYAMQSGEDKQKQTAITVLQSLLSEKGN